MKQTIQISTLIIFTVLVVFPSAAISEVKVTLKNGRDIIADSCTDSEGGLTCEKGSGTFRIDKKDVLDMKTITIERRRTVEEAAPVATSSDEKKDEPKDVVTGKVDEKAPAKAPVGEQEKRLAEITAKRAAYEAEREALMKEREQLREEVKAAGILSTNGQYQYYDQKLKDMEGRIKAFNDKVNKLNEEIGIDNGPQKKTP
jgi:hypothetical protein